MCMSQRCPQVSATGRLAVVVVCSSDDSSRVITGVVLEGLHCNSMHFIHVNCTALRLIALHCIEFLCIELL